MIMRGAEAEIRISGYSAVKKRTRKKYRIAQLDKQLITRRTRQETRLIREAGRAGVHTPKIIEQSVDTITMEFIEGEKARDVFDENYTEISERIGESVALLHNFDIIHGDLTTSNMIIKPFSQPNDALRASAYREKALAKRTVKSTADKPDFSLYFIDFGLGFVSSRAEDKANDLYLLREVLESTHFIVSKKAWKIIVDAYTASYKGSEKVIKALSKVEKRRRYKK